MSTRHIGTPAQVAERYERRNPVKRFNDPNRKDIPVSVSTTYVQLVQSFRASGMKTRNAKRAANRELHAMRHCRELDLVRVHP